MQNASNVPTPPASLDPAHFDRLWTDGIAWIAGNSIAVLIAVAAAAAIVFIFMGIRSLGVRACRNDRLGTGWPGVFGRVIARTHLWFMIAAAAELVERYTAPPPAVAHTVQTLFTIATALQAAVWARELVLGIIDKRTNAGSENHAFGSAVGIIKVLVSIAFFAIAVVLILDNLGVNVTGLVAGLGIGGIAIGLAAQGIFSDLFAALSMIFDKPFEVGDTINYDQTTGTVERIGLKSTRIRSANGEMIAISNAKLLEKELRNYSEFDHRRFTNTLSVVYQTPIDTCRRIPEIVASIIADYEEGTLIRCALANLAPSSLDFELIFDIATHIKGDPFLIRSEIYLNIIQRFGEEGIAFAYPTQTTFTAAPDGRLVMPWPEPREEC